MEFTEFTPRVMSEYEIGHAMAAIEAVSLLEKPIAEIVGLRADPEELEKDLRDCLKLAGNPERVYPWIRTPTGKHLRCGFYREEWTLEALDFLDRAILSPYDRHWISGLLFGYRADAIQQFIDTHTKGKKPRRYL